MANILIVDDEHEIAELVALHLARAHHTPHTCTTPAEALAAPLGSINAAVLDVMLPGMSGFELCRQLREAGHTFPILMLTARDSASDKIGGLTLGADDYIVKPFDPLELVARVNAQLRRAEVFSAPSPQGPAQHEVRGLVLVPQAHTCTLYGKPVPLTPLEFSILLLLCENMGRVVSSEEIFETVWQEKYLESNNTVMVHIQKVRKKLGDTGKTKKFIQTVWGVGYKIEN